MREYRSGPHLKHLILFMCKHRAQSLLNMPENNHVSIERLGRPYYVYFSLLNTLTLCSLSHCQDLVMSRSYECVIAVSFPLLFSYFVLFFCSFFFFSRKLLLWQELRTESWTCPHSHLLKQEARI